MVTSSHILKTLKKKIDLKKKCIKRNFDEKLLNLQNPF